MISVSNFLSYGLEKVSRAWLASLSKIITFAVYKAYKNKGEYKNDGDRGSSTCRGSPVLARNWNIE